MGSKPAREGLPVYRRTARGGPGGPHEEIGYQLRRTRTSRQRSLPSAPCRAFYLLWGLESAVPPVGLTSEGMVRRADPTSVRSSGHIVRIAVGSTSLCPKPGVAGIVGLLYDHLDTWPGKLFMSFRPPIGSWVKRGFIGFLPFWAVVSGCAGGSKTSDLDIQVIQIEQFMEMRENRGVWETKSPTVVVDVRSVEVFSRGHIPGAVNIPVVEFRAEDHRLVGVHNIVVYGSGLMDYLSAAASKKLASLGYENVYDFRAGLWMWERQGHEIATFGEAGDL